MKAPARILIGTVTGFLIVATGLSAGLHLKFRKAGDAPAIQISQPNFNTYDISPPSRGIALKTVDVDIVPAGDESFVQIPADIAANVKTGQRILLHDANGNLLDTLGAVTAVEHDGDAPQGWIIVRIILNGDSDVPVDGVTRGRIITGQNSSAQRLPLAAIVKSGDGTAHLWETHENEDGTHTAYYKQANVTMTADEYVVVDQKAPGDNVFVLNPDDKLKDGDKINVRKTLFSAPTQTDQGRIEALMEARHSPYRQYKRERERQMAGRHSEPAPPPPPYSVQGCAPPAATTDAFIKQIKNLAAQQPAQSLP